MSKRNSDFFDKKKPWSVVKDELLACYLLPYFQKILSTRRSITYVDCFAGAGKFNDGADGSPLIALKNIETALTQSKNSAGNIEFYFIEANHAETLKKNLSEYPNAEVIGGRYEDKIQSILADKRGRNVFLYIDPYGVRELDLNFLGSLSNGNFHTIELLINFNSAGFLRMAFSALDVEFKNEADLQYLDEYDADTLPQSKQALMKTADTVAGGDYWKKIIEDYRQGDLTFYGAEERFVAEYCQKLREHYRYVLNMAIRIKTGQSPKYRMIHATNHPDGAVLMAKNMLSRSELMREIQRGKQLCLFDDESTFDMEKILSEYLSQFQSFTRLNYVLAEFFCKYGVADVTDILKRFETQGKIVVKRDPALTKKTAKPSRFWEEKGSQTVKLKWNT